MSDIFRRVLFATIIDSGHPGVHAALFYAGSAAENAVGVLRRFGFSPANDPVTEGTRVFSFHLVQPGVSMERELATAVEVREFLAGRARLDLLPGVEKVLLGDAGFFESDTAAGGFCICAKTAGKDAAVFPPY